MIEDAATWTGPAILDVTPAEYHADPCPTPALSVSIAKTLLDRSPAHAYAEHPKLGASRRKRTTTAMDRGSLVHKLLLGAGAEIAVIEAKNFTTKAARAVRDEARAAGLIPALAGQYARAVKAAVALRGRLGALGIVFDGESELPIAWQEQTYRGPIWCRAMLDHVVGSTIYDIKTTETVTMRRCARLAVDLGYTLQAAAYTRALEALRPDLEGRVDFVLVFVETEEPYAVLPARLDGVLREHGERRWESAVTTWAECLYGDRWPSVADRIERLEAPGWLLSSMEEA